MVKSILTLLVFTILLMFSSYGLLKHIHAQGKYDFLISLQGGFQHTGYSSNDEYIDTIQKKHGDLTNTRVVNPLIVSFEIYHLQGSLGVGFGLENQRYSTEYYFVDGSKIYLNAQVNYHNLLLKYNGDLFEPFLGIGTGTYSANVNENLNQTSSTESTEAFMRISNRHSHQGKLGIRMSLYSYCGIMVATYSISAPINVPTENKKLELGGDSIVTGIFCQF